MPRGALTDSIRNICGGAPEFCVFRSLYGIEALFLSRASSHHARSLQWRLGRDSTLIWTMKSISVQQVVDPRPLPVNARPSGEETSGNDDSRKANWRPLRIRIMLGLFLAEISLLIWYLGRDPLASSLYVRLVHPAEQPLQEDHTAEFVKDPSPGFRLAEGNLRSGGTRTPDEPANGYLVVAVGDCASCLHVDLPALERKTRLSGIDMVLITTATEARANEFVRKSKLHTRILSDPRNRLGASLNAVWLGRAYLFSSDCGCCGFSTIGVQVTICSLTLNSLRQLAERSMKTARAFSVVELLVVIGILVILAALLLAAFGPARESARKATCISNLNQISRALHMYRADYDGGTAVEGKEATYGELGLPAAGDMFVNMSRTYLRSRDVLFCPDWHKLYVDDPRPLRRESMTTTYYWLIPPDEDTFPAHAKFAHRVALRGESLVISECPFHNPAVDLRRAPRWATMRVNILRLSGQVEAKVVPLSSSAKDW